MSARWKGVTLVEMLMTIAMISLLLAIALSALVWSRERIRQTRCLSNLHQQSRAALSFEQRMTRLPGGDIRPLYVEFSSDFGQPDLYSQFEPQTPLIDDPNLTLGRTNLALLSCSTAENRSISPYLWPQTHFTLSSRIEGMSLAGCVDGTTNTLMFFEFADIQVSWIEAAPMPPNIADVLNGRHAMFHLATCGGNTIAITKSIDVNVFYALLSPDGREAMNY